MAAPDDWIRESGYRVGELADHAPGRKGFVRTLSAVAHAIASEPGVLGDRRLRLFHLAYVDALGLERLSGLIGTSTPVAIRKRLYRISRRIEKALFVSVTPLLTQRSRARILAVVGPHGPEPGFSREKNENPASAAMTELCDEVVHALDAVIHRNPGRLDA